MAHRRHRSAAAYNQAKYWEDQFKQRSQELEDIYGVGMRKGLMEGGDLQKLWQAAPGLQGEGEWAGTGAMLDTDLMKPYRQWNILGKDAIGRGRGGMHVMKPSASPQHSKGVTLSGMLRGAEDRPEDEVYLGQDAMGHFVGMHEKEKWWEQQDPKIKAKQEQIAEAQRQAAASWANYAHHQSRKAREEYRKQSVQGFFMPGGTSGATGAITAGLAGAGPVGWAAYAVMTAYKTAMAQHQTMKDWDKTKTTLSDLADRLRQEKGIPITGRQGPSGAGFEMIDIFGRPTNAS